MRVMKRVKSETAKDRLAGMQNKIHVQEVEIARFENCVEVGFRD